MIKHYRLCTVCGNEYEDNDPTDHAAICPACEMLSAESGGETTIGRAMEDGGMSVINHVQKKRPHLPKPFITAKRICESCKTLFVAVNKGRTICDDCLSAEMSDNRKRRKAGLLKEKICDICSQTFESNKNAQKYCDECRKEKYKKLTKATAKLHKSSAGTGSATTPPERAPDPSTSIGAVFGVGKPIKSEEDFSIVDLLIKAGKISVKDVEAARQLLH